MEWNGRDDMGGMDMGRIAWMEWRERNRVAEMVIS